MIRSLYISGFSGLGFRRTTTESGDVETFDLLNGASDPDTHDVLTATNIVVLATDSEGNVVDVTGPTRSSATSFQSTRTISNTLAYGQSVTLVATYDVSDGHVVMHNSATLVVNGEGEASNILPVANAVEASGNEDAYSIASHADRQRFATGIVTGFKLLSLPTDMAGSTATSRLHRR